MAKPPQFTLQYLFLEIFWVASALGCATQAYRIESPGLVGLQLLLGLYAVLCFGTAMGGLFDKMEAGFLITAGLLAIGVIALILVVGSAILLHEMGLLGF